MSGYFVPVSLDEPYDIYALIDPRDNTVHYLGISANTSYRYQQHLKRKKCNPRKSAWIQSLQIQGLQPQLHIIEQVKGRAQAKERERSWIHFYGEQGSPLTNIHANPYEIPKGVVG